MDSKDYIFKVTPILEKVDVNKSRLVIGRDSDVIPIVSIVMPVYNHPDFFKESVLSAVSQETDIPFEIIVVDNNHPDYQTINQKIVASVGSSILKYYVNEENLRFSGNCNMGIALARGKFIMFCHDDDLLMPNAINSVLDIKNKLGEDLKEAAIFGNIIPIDDQGKHLPYNNEWDNWLFPRNRSYYRITLKDFLQKNYTNGCGALYSRERLIELGGFSQEYSPCADFALNIIYTSQYGSVSIRPCTFMYRITSQSDTGKVYQKLPEATRLLKKRIIEYCKLACYYKYFLSIYEKVYNYHLYSKWSGLKRSSTNLLIFRMINVLIGFLYTTSRVLRSK